MQSKIVRGPRGVQMEEVWAAADAVLALGERPTIERVRLQLGRGSPNTVGPMLDGWYGSLAKRLQTPTETVDGQPDAEIPLPGPIIKAAKTLWGRALQHANESATAQFTQARTEMTEQAEALRHDQEELEQEKQRLKDRSEAYAVALRVKDERISELSRNTLEVQQQLLACQQQLDNARSDGAQARQAAEMERRRHEARDAEYKNERSRLEERAQAQERRLNAEVDRARQESRRLAQQREGDNKNAAKSLADVMNRARELEAHVGTLQIENAGLSQELESAREKVKGLQTQFSERSNDMFAMLNELRERLPATSDHGAASPPPRSRRKRS